MTSYLQNVSRYLSPLLDPDRIKQEAAIIVEDLKYYREQVDFSAIAVSGVSGLILSGHLSIELDVALIVVRKTMEGTHSKNKVEGPMEGRYIIFDDLICTGKTVERMIEDISNSNPYAEHVGTYLYNDCNQKVWYNKRHKDVS